MLAEFREFEGKLLHETFEEAVKTREEKMKNAMSQSKEGTDGP